MLRLASWRASRFGLDDHLIHPLDIRPRPAEVAVTALLDHVRPVLAESGDYGLVDRVVTGILTDGTGADRQRAVLGRGGNLRKVIPDAAGRTVRPAAPA